MVAVEGGRAYRKVNIKTTISTCLNWDIFAKEDKNSQRC